MKYRYPLLLLALGLLLMLIGSLLKIRHWPGGDVVLLIGLALQGSAFLLFIYRLFVPSK